MRTAGSFPLITVITCLPIAGAALVVLLGQRCTLSARTIAKTFSGLVLLGVVILLFLFNRASGSLQFVERHPWIPSLGVEYHVGVDGLSLLLLCATALLTCLTVWLTPKMIAEQATYYSFVLLLEAGLIGTFSAQNFFHWFVFWEIALIPAFFLIRNWGEGDSQRVSVQFFIYTMAGSLLLLVSFGFIYLLTGTMDFEQWTHLARSKGWANEIAERLKSISNFSSSKLAVILCVSAFAGFAVKIPIYPLHGWLASTYETAPSQIVILLTGAMSKMGIYGIARLLIQVFPHELGAIGQWIVALVVLSTVASAALATQQRDIKRILAYSSMNHLGYCALVLVLPVATVVNRTPQSVQLAFAGSFLQLFNHAIIAGTLFAFVALLEERTARQRGIDIFGGLRKVMPIFCGMWGIAIFASMGLPGLSGFIGEFLIFWATFLLMPSAAVIVLFGLLFTTIFYLTFMRKLFHGPINTNWAALQDMTVRERCILAIPLALIFLGGLMPQTFLVWINSTVTLWAQQLLS